MDKTELMRKLNTLIERGENPIVILNKPITLTSGSFSGYEVAKLAIMQGAVVDIIEPKSRLKYTPPFLNRKGTHIKKWSGRKKRYRLQYGNRGFWVRKF
jgi:hypothetical protein